MFIVPYSLTFLLEKRKVSQRKSIPQLVDILISPFRPHPAQAVYQYAVFPSFSINQNQAKENLFRN
jgi:hypothetical protein